MRRTATSCTDDVGRFSDKKPANNGWDAYYIRWLEDPDITIGKDLRLEIAARLKELIAEPELHAGS